jgi:hypothetical protein
VSLSQEGHRTGMTAMPSSLRIDWVASIFSLPSSLANIQL